MLPEALHPAIRSSKYYTAGSDSWTIHAQAHRSRTANLDDNQRKLVDEIERIYSERVPGETSETKKDKHRDM